MLAEPLADPQCFLAPLIPRWGARCQSAPRVVSRAGSAIASQKVRWPVLFFSVVLSLSSFLITGRSHSADTSSPEGRGGKEKEKKNKTFLCFMSQLPAHPWPRLTN